MLYIYVWNFFFQAFSGFLNPFTANNYVFGVLLTSMSSLKSRLSCPELLLLRTLLYVGICKKLELKQEVVQEPVSSWREHRQSRHDVLKAGIGLNLYWVIDSLGASPWGDGLALEPPFVSHGYKVCFGSRNIVNIHFSRKQQLPSFLFQRLTCLFWVLIMVAFFQVFYDLLRQMGKYKSSSPSHHRSHGHGRSTAGSKTTKPESLPGSKGCCILAWVPENVWLQTSRKEM